MKVQLLLGALLPLVSAHFELIYPAARGFDEDNLGQFPCGGQNTVTTNRTEFPITGAPIQLLMGHTSAKVQVLLALETTPAPTSTSLFSLPSRRRVLRTSALALVLCSSLLA
ncbi:unnamed protein product [Aureobasidium pullulans]|nr:unnamed protein product [Aureobasidium pullulans]CAD0023524.1 unnamed protein product [Aureobasidium pullulans]